MPQVCEGNRETYGFCSIIVVIFALVARIISDLSNGCLVYSNGGFCINAFLYHMWFVCDTLAFIHQFLLLLCLQTGLRCPGP